MSEFQVSELDIDDALQEAARLKAQLDELVSKIIAAKPWMPIHKTKLLLLRRAQEYVNRVIDPTMLLLEQTPKMSGGARNALLRAGICDLLDVFLEDDEYFLALPQFGVGHLAEVRMAINDMVASSLAAAFN